jgi:prokaryotic ubiquitin-like protein Pup
MSERIQKQKTSEEAATEEVDSVTSSNRQGEKIKAELDDLLDEIDSVLEENAEDFVKGYVQKGGQ